MYASVSNIDIDLSSWLEVAAVDEGKIGIHFGGMAYIQLNTEEARQLLTQLQGALA